ncbi:uncharacterized protein [Dendropsophus ebraccatus]|uniref:uncharacterized protein isoform X5 n=1 Tax=Dendropsophus ebraccatus TaxID=150705 RepID=UPI003831E1B0
MDKTRNKRKSKTLIPTKDFQAGLDRNEKTFQAKMLEIFKKFDHPFVNDYIVNIEDFTFETPQGRRKWNFEINMSENVNSDRVVSAEHIQETEDFEETNLTESENSDRVVSAEHIQETENFEETNLTESEDEHSSDQACTILMECEEDNAYCDDREKPVSTQNSGSSVHSMITSVGLPLKAQGYRLMKSKENDVKSPGRYNAAICAADDSGSSENAGKSYCGLTLENMYPQIIQTFSNLWNSYIKNQAADNIVRFHKKKVLCKNKKVLGNWATCIDSTLSRKNSEFTMSQSPKTALAKLNYNKGERTLIPRKDMTTRSWIDTDGTIYKKFRENTKDLQNRTCAVVNRNSFSAHFSEHHREHADFESLYRDLTQGRPQPVLPQGKAPVQLSQTFFPSVNSPGSQRAKRPLCDDYSSSLSKIPRSLTKAINQRSNFVDGSDMLWSGSCSSPLQQHSEVAASLPAHMLPSSPMSLRSSSPGVNARSPKRTNARKLSFKGKNGSSTGN